MGKINFEMTKLNVVEMPKSVVKQFCTISYSHIGFFNSSSCNKIVYLGNNNNYYYFI